MTDRVGQYLSNYRLLRPLGRGGFATVYLGKHPYLKSLAALKVLHTHLNGEDTAQFMREAQLLAGLSHPHIVRVLDFAVQDGMPFLVMDYAPGGSLRQCHPAGTPLPIQIMIGSAQEPHQGSASFHNRSSRVEQLDFPWRVQQFHRTMVPLFQPCVERACS